MYLARSRIQGLGLYAKRDIDMNSMLIEYIGEMIRSEVLFIKSMTNKIDWMSGGRNAREKILVSKPWCLYVPNR